MKKLIIAGRSILAGILWIAGASSVFIGFLFAAKPIFEPTPDSRGEVAQFLTAMILVFVMTIITILLLTKSKRTTEAISIAVIGILVGGYTLLIFAGFGGFQILLGQ